MDLERFYAELAPIVGVAMVVLFGSIAAWAYWPKHKARFERDAEIPLREDD